MRRKNEFKLWTLEDVKWKNIKGAKTNEELIKELTEIIDNLLAKSRARINMIKTLGEIVENYKKENADLKNQLAETRTLNRDEVENILRNYHLSAQEKLDEICKLAIPKIDKENLINKLINYGQQCEMRQGNTDYRTYADILASEIIKELEE